MAEGMNLRLIAEGVETQEQVDFLRGKKCRGAQGFLFSRPLSTQNIESFLRKNIMGLELMSEPTGDGENSRQITQGV